MIQIKPYTKLPAREEIKKQYLELVAWTLPFHEADLTGNPALFPKNLFDRKKSKAKSLPTAEESEQIIRTYSIDLHSFLFDKGGKLRRERLYTLLFSPMDEKSREENSLNFTDSKPADEKSCEENSTKSTDSKPAGEIQRVFSYDRFSSSSKMYRFVQMLDVPVCPYCNRSFTTTLVREAHGKAKTRPELDHYLDKNHYPYFALSIMNLIPSCGTCNRLKSNKDERILYPYAEGMGDSYRFETQPKEDMSYLTGAKVDFSLRLVQSGSAEAGFRSRAEKSKEILGLEALYQEAHRDFVSELLFQRYVFTDELLTELLEQFGEEDHKLFESVDDIKRLLYLRSIAEEHWGERPLSKLVHDVDMEITALKTERKIEEQNHNRKASPDS